MEMTSRLWKIDFTRERVDSRQRAIKGATLARPELADVNNVEFRKGDVSQLPMADGEVDQMKVEQLESTRSDARPKLFILNPQDSVSLAALTQLYPQGWFQLYKSQEQTKDFILFMVPPQLPQTP